MSCSCGWKNCNCNNTYTKAALNGYGALSKSEVNRLMKIPIMKGMIKRKIEKQRKEKEEGGHAIFPSGSRNKRDREEFERWVNNLEGYTQRQKAALMPYREGTLSDAEVKRLLGQRYKRIPKYVKAQLPSHYTDTDVGREKLVASLYRLHNVIYPEHNVQLRRRGRKITAKPKRRRRTEAQILSDDAERLGLI